MSVVHILPQKINMEAPAGTNLLELLRSAGAAPDAPCGGQGRCGKCTVNVNGRDVLACQTTVETELTVTVPEKAELRVMRSGIENALHMEPLRPGHLLAIDIGTTSVVCFLLDERDGHELASESALNAQASFGGDVISRIRAALDGELEAERDMIRAQLTDLIRKVCDKAGVAPAQVGVVSVVGNPTMQQLFLGIPTENLARVPFAPVITEAKAVACREFLPLCENALLLIVPDISGYIGADTMGCVLSTGLYKSDELTLMVDIGTNGEMVLGNKDRLLACSTAAGPALEGANILFGMRGADGAIDHVKWENGALTCTVIGGGEAKGICGSGLIDAAAALLNAGLMNKRGRIQSASERDGQRIVELTDRVYLTQDDIRQLQLAKGAICAGIQLMAKRLGRHISDIRRVLLAGAFGSFMDPESAVSIGLLPEALRGRIVAVGNAAGAGAKLLACDKAELARSQRLREQIEFLELASLPEFTETFARAMYFREKK